MQATIVSPGAIHGKEKALYILSLAFFFSLYMPVLHWLYNALMWMLVAFSFYFNTLREKWALLKQRKAMLLMMLFFLLNLLSALLSRDVAEGISWVGIRLSLFAFPLAWGSISLSSNLKNKLLGAYILATTAGAAMCLSYGLFRSFYYHDWSLMYNDNLSELTDLQSIYVALLVNIALLFTGYLWLIRSPLLKSYRWVPVLTILLPFHFLLASRTAIIFLYGLVLVFAVYKMVAGRQKMKAAVIMALLILVAALFYKTFPKTFNRFKEMNYTNFNYQSMARESHYNVALSPDQWNGANLRLAIWNCAWAVTRQHWLFGTGLGDKLSELKKMYAAKGFTFAYKSNRNTHNAYLDVWMSLGIVVFIIFITGFFVLPLAGCLASGNWLGVIVIMAFALSLVTETYLDRTIGNTLLSFFIPFMMLGNKEAKSAEVKDNN